MTATTYTTEQCAEFRTRLAEAEAARHDIAIGNREVEIQHANKRTRYSEANLGALLAYITELKGKIALCDGCARRPRSFRIMPTGN